jgi:cGMP-dependent protein kinase
MGCTSSVPRNDVTMSSNPSRTMTNKEQKLEMVFKAKRANVFSESVDVSGTSDLSTKKFTKTSKQETTIKSILHEIFIFSSLHENELRVLIDAFEPKDIANDEAIITQGEQGDYFYIIEKGTFHVYTNKEKVGVLGEGNSSKYFGELALLYNQPRAATIKAKGPASVFQLDRNTFRYVVAKSNAQTTSDIQNALSKVPLLNGLTKRQLATISNAVEIISYEAGEKIFEKGSIGKHFYIIKEGKVKLTEVGGDDGKFVDQSLGLGEYFGERASITGDNRAANAVAETKVSLMVLDSQAFNKLLGPLHDVIDHNMNVRILRSIELFKHVRPDELNKMVKSFKEQTFKAGSQVITEGERGDTFYIIKSGTVTVTVKDQEVGVLEPGKYFGEMALLGEGLRLSSVTATTNLECFTLDSISFTQIIGPVKNLLKRESENRKKELENIDSSDVVDDPLKLKFEDLKTLAVLGAGTFGRVTLVQDAASKKVYALKTLLKSEIVQHKQQANVLNEKNVMMCCNHPFILRLFQTFKDPRKLYMLLEFVQGGELFSVLHTPQNDGVPDPQAKFYGAGILLALSYMHSKNIAYRDMKPENCLIDSLGYPKVVDFGFSKVIEDKTYTLCGTPEYLAPELVLSKGHNKAVDVWAYGILLYEMEAGYSPFSDPDGNDQTKICRNIVNGRLVFPRNFNQSCKDLVQGLLIRDVNNRLGNLKGGCDDIKNSEWFKDFDFNAYLNKKIKAPWLPKIKNELDTSCFDPYDADERDDSNYGRNVNANNWDADF